MDRPPGYWTAAFLLAAFYLATSLYISAHRLLWYDELFTVLVCRLPSLGTMWSALSQGADQTPLLYALVMRVSDTLFGHSDIGVRVPSAVAMAAGMLVVFDAARRIAGGACGLAAMAVLSTSFVMNYGFEGRPYALFFLFASLALWQWVATRDESWKAACVFGGIVLLGMSTHIYFVFTLAPFGIFCIARRRWLHPKLIAGAVGVACGLAAAYPIIAGSMAAVKANAVSSWAHPTAKALQGVYGEFFPLSAVPLAATVILLACFARRRSLAVPDMGDGERLAWLFLSIPLACYIAAALVTDFFYNRYMIGTVPGVAVGVTCMLWRHCREARFLVLAVVLLFAGFGAREQWLRARLVAQIQPASALGDEGDYPYDDHQARVRTMLEMEPMLRSEGKTLVAYTGSLLYLETWFYSKNRSTHALYWPWKPWIISRYVPLRYLSLEDIVANARHIALVSPDPELIKELEEAGLRARTRVDSPLNVVYLE